MSSIPPPAPSASRPPLIGITCDVEDLKQPAVIRQRIRVGTTYAECVMRAGGVPVMLLPDLALVDRYVQSLDGFIFTGGMDVDTRSLPGANKADLHPLTEIVHPQRQAFELALLAAIDKRPSLPVLGVCLGMQIMGAHKGCRMIQHLGDKLGTADLHREDTHHAIAPAPAWSHSRLASLDGSAAVASNHHQALADPGPLRVLARSSDGVLEAVDDPARPFYVGVQWHPERTRDPALGQRVFDELVRAARAQASA